MELMENASNLRGRITIARTIDVSLRLYSIMRKNAGFVQVMPILLDSQVENESRGIVTQ